MSFQLRWIKYWFLSNVTILFNNALNVVHWYSRILRIAHFKSPAFVDNCCTFILSIWILIQQTFASVDHHKNKIKNIKRYTNDNKTTVFAISLMLNTSLFETYVETNHAMKRKYYDTRTGIYCSCMNISPSHLFSDTNKNLKINHTMTIETKYNDYIYNKHAAFCCFVCFVLLQLRGQCYLLYLKMV